MSKQYLIHISCITILVFSTSTFCNQTHFTKLCDSTNIDHEFDTRESRINISPIQAQETLEHFLAMSRTILDAQSNISSTHTSPRYVEKLVNATVINHHLAARDFYTSRDHGLIQSAKGKTQKANLVVAQDGSGDFNTIAEAVRASEKQRKGNHRFVIYVKAGIYKEIIVIKSSMSNLMLIGDGVDATIITNNRNVHEGVLTRNTATVQVWGSGFVAVGITFENTAGPKKQQAIALLSASNLSVFYKCSFKGYQDTLCALQYRQFYRECDIYGTIDFIFGDASAVFQKCNIYVRKPLPGQQNTITAQGRTSSGSNTGFVIHNSRVIPAPDLTQAHGPVMTYLGRPWRDYARVVYVKCYLDTLIDPAGWLRYISDSAFDKVFYAEYMNTGKGANTRRRVRWRGYHVLTTGKEVERFSVRMFLHGESWIPQTRVPFNAGI